MAEIEANTKDLAQQGATAIEDVIGSQCDEFDHLVKLLKLDKTRDFRYCDLSSVDFGNADLRGYDFTGSLLPYTKLDSAQIDDTTIFSDCMLNGADYTLEQGEIIFGHLNEYHEVTSEEIFWLISNSGDNDDNSHLSQICEVSHLLRPVQKIGDIIALGDKYSQLVRVDNIIDIISTNPFAVWWILKICAESPVVKAHVKKKHANIFANHSKLGYLIGKLAMDSQIRDEVRLDAIITFGLYSGFGAKFRKISREYFLKIDDYDAISYYNKMVPHRARIYHGRSS